MNAASATKRTTAARNPATVAPTPNAALKNPPYGGWNPGKG